MMRVAVLGGGRSSEHEVSRNSAASIADGLRDGGHDVVTIDCTRDGRWLHDGAELALAPGGGLLGCDVVFIGLHGAFGEDGTVQGLLELLDVPYTGSGVLASALCLDKLHFKDLMAAHGIPQVGYAGAFVGQELPDTSSLSWPLWVKPARMGSSVGIAPATGEAELIAAVNDAWQYDDRVIIEAAAPGIEVECSALGATGGPAISTPGEIVLAAGSDWYDYEAKYSEGGMRLQVPARISARARELLTSTAARAFTAAGCSGYARIDFFVDGDQVLLNEINTLPGHTATSVYGTLWAHDGVAYPDLLERICRIAIERAEADRALRF